MHELLSRTAVGLLLSAVTGIAAATGSQTVLEIPPAAQAGPAFDVDRATEAYLQLLGETARARSDAYFEGGYWLALWDLLCGLGVAWLLLGTGLSARMRGRAERLGRWRWLQVLVYWTQYLLISAVLLFALTLYRDFFRERAYGLATQAFTGWFADQLKALMVTLILGGAAVVLLYWVIRRAGRMWWLWGGVGSVLFLMFVMLIAPVYIAPLFNEYKPLEAGPLKQSILAMARANGVPADDVFQFDASRQSTRISANVSGFLGTTRISLNDNLLNATSAEEIRAVMGHELGHYVMHHSLSLIIAFGLLVIVALAVVDRSFARVCERWGGAWGIRDVADPAGLPLLVALASIFFFLATPVTNSIVRVHESEADNYGLNVAREPDGFARVAMRLSAYRKIRPGTWEEIIFFDHPSGYQRVHRSMQWKAVNQVPQPPARGCPAADRRMPSAHRVQSTCIERR